MDPSEKHKKVQSVLEKQYVARKSLLTDLLEVKHIKTIYNIFIVITVILFIQTATYDLIVVGKLNLCTDLILWCFQGFSTAMLYWLIMNFTTVLLYYCFNIWATQRILLSSTGLRRTCWDYGWLICLIMYQIMFLYIPAVTVLKSPNIHTATSLALLMEQIRLMMKTHSFVRSNAPRALTYKAHQSEDKHGMSVCPDFSKFFYFLFAPTLLYRDSYPRTKEICWKFVAQCFMEVLFIIFCFALVFERHFIPLQRDFGLPNHRTTSTIEYMLTAILGCMLPGMFFLCCMAYGLLHAWSNAFAEMLRFADRLFYEDWWAAPSLVSYYRLWNHVVGDWLRTYIYKECSEIVWQGNRFYPTLAVFMISAVFHEYVLSISFRFFYPVLFITYAVISVPLAYATKNIQNGNFFVWLCMFIGLGIVFSLYGIEWHARVNCPRVLDPIWDFFTPRSWTCENP